MKVFAVVTQSVWDITNEDLNVEVFKTKEEAIAEVESTKKLEKEIFADNFDPDEICLEEYKGGGFEIYQDGYYCENHTSCTIFEKEV